MDGDGDRSVAFVAARGCRSAAGRLGSASSAVELPLAPRAPRAAGAGRPSEPPSSALGDLDVVEADDRVDLDRMRVGLLAHDLAVELALRRDVDHDVAGDTGGAAEAAPVARARGRRRSAPRPRPAGDRLDAVDVIPCFACSPSDDLDLAASTDAAAAADRVEVDTEPPRRLEHGRAVRRTGLACRTGVKTTSASGAVTTLRPSAGPRGHRAGRAWLRRSASHRFARSRSRSARRFPSARRLP